MPVFNFRYFQLLQIAVGLLLMQLGLGLSKVKAADGIYVNIQFYSAELTFPSMPEMFTQLPAKLNEEVFRDAHAYFETTEYLPFLKKVGDYRRGMNLSDWHYYDIIAKYSEQVFPDAGSNFQVLFQWFVLRKSGIDARLFHTDTQVFLNALSNDVEFGFYIMQLGDKKYVNLTAKRSGIELGDLTAYMPSFVPDSAIMPFSMKLASIPRLGPSSIIERLIEFKHKEKTYQVKVELNKLWLQMMDEYPFYNQKSYFEVGLSREAEASLLPKLENFMTYMTDVEKVQFLLSFTRTAFFYKDDAGKYGKEKPMTPEQTLYHSYSDCEDRSALFFFLCRKMLNLPEIVLDFETHVGVAVVLEGVDGQYYKYKGKRFVYCEPTGPQDVLKPGEMWDEVKAQKARILLEYIPE